MRLTHCSGVYLQENILSCKQRVVVVSTSTASLDLVDKLLCQPKGYSVVRIDGSTSVDDRQVVVSGCSACSCIADSFAVHSR